MCYNLSRSVEHTHKLEGYLKAEAEHVDLF